MLRFSGSGAKAEQLAEINERATKEFFAALSSLPGLPSPRPSSPRDTSRERHEVERQYDPEIACLRALLNEEDY